MVMEKTIKELAENFGVSKEAIRKNVSKIPEEHVRVGTNRTIYIDDLGVQYLRDLMSKTNNSSTKLSPKIGTLMAIDYKHKLEKNEIEMKLERKNYKEKIKSLQDQIQMQQNQIEMQKEQIQILQKQLEAKDNQIADMLKTLDQQQILTLHANNRIESLENRLQIQAEAKEEVVVEEEKEEEKGFLFKNWFKRS